jgi:S-DNA-T family DNA segregation ATPase FtsK/SpoIIIE
VVSGVVAVKNGAGFFGAYLSGLLVDVFGFAAFVWPLFFLAWGAGCVSSLITLPWWRWLGFFLLALCLLSLGTAWNLGLADVRGGGMLGRLLHAHGTRLFSPAGFTLIWLFFLFISLELSFGIPWLDLIGRVWSFIRVRARAAQPALAAARRALSAHRPRLSLPAGYLRPARSGGSGREGPLIIDLDMPVDVPESGPGDPGEPSETDAYVAPPEPPEPPASAVIFREALPHELEAATGEDGFVFGDDPAQDGTDAEQEDETPAMPFAPPRPAPPDHARPGQARPGKRRPLLPGLDLLARPEPTPGAPPSREVLAAKGEQLMACLSDFGIQGELAAITPGPVISMFEIRPAPGVKVSRILGLSDDLARVLKATAVRIQAPVPGSDTVGVEIPNDIRAVVSFRELLQDPSFSTSGAPLAMALGKDISGRPVAEDLSRMPHILVAGATGAGKSVCLNSMLLSFLYKCTPDEVRLLLVDPKRGVEFGVYKDLPHLVHPVVTEIALAKTALDWAVHEMETRYDAMARLRVRNVADFNRKLAAYGEAVPPDVEDLRPLPLLVIVIDELADLMTTAGKDIETPIVRLAQLARAAGIHLIVATQRPSVNVVTGLIKANFPCRISFQVTSGHDSRTILDTVGAEHLLGKGDMLFKPSGGKLRRLHGAFVSDDEVAAVVAHWKSQLAPDYAVDFEDWSNEADSGTAAPGPEPESGDAEDALYADIVNFVREQGGKVSISLIQRRFRIGFNKAARFVERMEQDGIVQQRK